MKGYMMVALVVVLAALLVECQDSKTSLCRDRNETCQNDRQCCRNLSCRRSGNGNMRRCVRNGGGIGNCAGMNDRCSATRRCCIGTCRLGRCSM